PGVRHLRVPLAQRLDVDPGRGGAAAVDAADPLARARDERTQVAADRALVRVDDAQHRRRGERGVDRAPALLVRPQAGAGRRDVRCRDRAAHAADRPSTRIVRAGAASEPTSRIGRQHMKYVPSAIWRRSAPSRIVTFAPSRMWWTGHSTLLAKVS